jgi:hypothetical protein
MRSRIGWSGAAFALVSVCVLALVILFGVPETQRVDKPATPGNTTAELTPRVPVEPAALEAVLAALVPPPSAADQTIDSIAARIVRIGPSAIPVVIGILCGEIPVPDLGSAATRLREPRCVPVCSHIAENKLLAPLPRARRRRRFARGPTDGHRAARPGRRCGRAAGPVQPSSRRSSRSISCAATSRGGSRTRSRDSSSNGPRARLASSRKCCNGKPELVPSILRVLAKTPSLRSATITVRAFGRNTELDWWSRSSWPP